MNPIQTELLRRQKKLTEMLDKVENFKGDRRKGAFLNLVRKRDHCGWDYEQAVRDLLEDEPSQSLRFVNKLDLALVKITMKYAYGQKSSYVKLLGKIERAQMAVKVKNRLKASQE